MPQFQLSNINNKHLCLVERQSNTEVMKRPVISPFYQLLQLQEQLKNQPPADVTGNAHWQHLSLRIDRALAVERPE